MIRGEANRHYRGKEGGRGGLWSGRAEGTRTDIRPGGGVEKDRQGSLGARGRGSSRRRSSRNK